jgi:putative transposase
LAEQLIADAIYRHDVAEGQLTLHADRGSSMTSRTVSQLLADLGVLQSHSRPHQCLFTGYYLKEYHGEARYMAA